MILKAKSEMFIVMHQHIANGQKEQYKHIVECATSTPNTNKRAHAHTKCMDRNRKIWELVTENDG